MGAYLTVIGREPEAVPSAELNAGSRVTINEKALGATAPDTGIADRACCRAVTHMRPSWSTSGKTIVGLRLRNVSGAA